VTISTFKLFQMFVLQKKNISLSELLLTESDRPTMGIWGIGLHSHHFPRGVHRSVCYGRNRFLCPHQKGLDSWVLDIVLLTWETCEHQRSAILEVAADWHELMVPRHSMQPSIVRNWTRGAARQTYMYHRPNQPH